MKTKAPQEILLFDNENSVYLAAGIDDFKKIVVSLANLSPVRTKLIDITKQPELAEKYCITVFPTLIIDNQAFVGKPATNKIIEIFESFA